MSRAVELSSENSNSGTRRTHKLGVLGLGGRGCHFGIREFVEADPRVQIVALCDLDPQKLQEASNRYGDIVPGARLYTDMTTFLADPEVVAVINCTGDPQHAETGIACLEAGKHLYLEKPMAQTIADCDALIEAWQRRPNVFMVGLELRYCTLFQDMRRLVDRGDIGRIVMGLVVDNVSVGGNYYFHGRKRREAYVGSLMLEKGTHSLDLANWFIGGHPRQVFCSAGLDYYGRRKPNDLRCRDCGCADHCDYFVAREGFRMDYGAVLQYYPDGCVFAEEIDVDDNSIVLVDYDNGARLSYLECHFTPEYTREFTFFGTEGKITAFYNNEQDFVIRVQRRCNGREHVYYPEKHPGAHGGGDYRIVREFMDMLDAGRPACKGIEGARDSAAIPIAALESARRNRPVVIPRVSPVE